jgi:DUF177 domain-containing protein
MSSGLPATVDAIRLADTGTRLAGEIPLKAMARLRGQCLGDQGEASVDLLFERSADRALRRIRGRISARVHVACQRCLEPMTLVLEAEPSLLIIKAGERAQLQTQDAELLVADKAVSLSELVEDELLLSMPMIPMHELSECPAAARLRSQQGSRVNPFAVLDKLKDNIK